MKTLFSFAPRGECLPPRPFGAFRPVRHPGKGPVRPVCKGPVRPPTPGKGAGCPCPKRVCVPFPSGRAPCRLLRPLYKYESAAPAQNPQPRSSTLPTGGSRPYIKEETLASRQGISLVRLVRSMRVGNPTFDRTNVARILVKNKFSTRFFTKKRQKIACL